MVLQVEESGLLGVTQQMSQFGSEITTGPPQSASQNPFASPNTLCSDLHSMMPSEQSASTNHSVIASHDSASNSPLLSGDSPSVSIVAVVASTPLSKCPNSTTPVLRELEYATVLDID